MFTQNKLVFDASSIRYLLKIALFSPKNLKSIVQDMMMLIINKNNFKNT